MQDLSSLPIKGIKDPWKTGINGWDVIDGRTITDNRTLEADVVIVGTGAGGGVSAEILSQRGLKVILVEAGKLKSSDDFKLNEGQAYRDLYQEGALRATKDAGMTILQGRTVGGTTVVNWTSCFRTPTKPCNTGTTNSACRACSARIWTPGSRRWKSGSRSESGPCRPTPTTTC